MHKALREMIVNTLAHSDYYGQKGVVIVRRPDSLSFANPGDMRPGLKTTLSGGLNLWVLIAIYRFMHLKATGFGQMIGIMGAIILFNLFASSSADEYSFSEERGSSEFLSST